MSEKITLNTSDVQFSKDTTTCEWNGINVEVKNYLSFAEFATFVRTIVNSCYTTKMEYVPEVFTFAVDDALIEAYTNITLPEDNSERYKIIVGTDLVETVVATINEYGNRRQLDDAMSAAKKKIDKINADASNLLEKEIRDIYTTINNVASNLQSSFGDIDKEQVQQMVNLLLDTKLDEKKIVETIFDEKEKRISDKN